jgi:ACS family hexuronate transporter-like MFS transporter
VAVGTLGFLWVLVWRRFYEAPEKRLPAGSSELRLILEDRELERAEVPDREAAKVELRQAAAAKAELGPAAPAELRPTASATAPNISAWRLLSYRQAWGAIAARGLTDPVWYMITDWFAIYLVAKGFRIEDTVAGFWLPFLGADLGNFFGGGLSSALIRRGWPVGRARKVVIVGGSVGVLALIPAAFLSGLPALVTCFGVATFSYAAMSTMALSLPADLVESRGVASVAGMAGTASGLGTIASTYAIGVVADRFSFTPILVVASLVPAVAAMVVLALVRNTAASGQGIVKTV